MEGIDETALDEGIALFNRRRFFEAHEVWEIGWRKAYGQEKLFFQGLIQVAATLLHAERGNAKGAEALAAKARQKLATLPSCVAGIEITELRRILDERVACTNGIGGLIAPHLQRNAPNRRY